MGSSCNIYNSLVNIIFSHPNCAAVQVYSPAHEIILGLGILVPYFHFQLLTLIIIHVKVELLQPGRIQVFGDSLTPELL